jgi:hypothetical protein
MPERAQHRRDTGAAVDQVGRSKAGTRLLLIPGSPAPVAFAAAVRACRRPGSARASVEITLTDAGDATGPRAEHVPTELSRALGLDEQANEELRATLRQLTNAVNAAAS